MKISGIMPGMAPAIRFGSQPALPPLPEEVAVKLREMAGRYPSIEYQKIEEGYRSLRKRNKHDSDDTVLAALELRVSERVSHPPRVGF